MAPNIHSRLSTDTRSISSLIEDIRRGEIKIPQFQRPFVWNEEQAINLIDSIASHYPIGSLLLWKTPSKLATERNIGDFLLPETDDLTPTDYVLDGQQRLTVIYSCLGAAQEDGGLFPLPRHLPRCELSIVAPILADCLVPGAVYISPTTWRSVVHNLLV